MKLTQFKLFANLLEEVSPTTICEIGVHKGITASQMVDHVLKTTDNNLQYTGYDAFDLLTSHKGHEKNGKGPASLEAARKRLNKMVKRYKGRFNYNLVIGWTSNTLIKPVIYDFVYIDGGHSYDSVLHDWNMVKDSKLVIFDDPGMPGVKKLLEEIAEIGYNIELYQNSNESRSVAVIRN